MKISLLLVLYQRSDGVFSESKREDSTSLLRLRRKLPHTFTNHLTRNRNSGVSRDSLEPDQQIKETQGQRCKLYVPFVNDERPHYYS